MEVLKLLEPKVSHTSKIKKQQQKPRTDILQQVQVSNTGLVFNGGARVH